MINLPRKIFVSLALHDGSDADAQERDRHVLDQALLLARKCGASVRVFHVLNYPEEALAPEWNALVAEERQLAIAALQRLIEELPEGALSGIPEISSGVAAGRPWYEVLREATNWQADLIVIGPAVQSSLLSRIMHGSTSGRLIRKSAIPLWIIDSDKLSLLERILVPVDLRPVSADLVALANQLHEATGAERYLLHCVSFPLDISMRRHPDAEDQLKKYHEETVSVAESRIDELLGPGREGWQVHVRRDLITDAVPEMIEKHDIDLLLIAGVSLPRVAGVLLGTTAEKILSKTHTPSYVIKPAGWESPVRFD